MKPECRELEELLSMRATGAELSAGEAARLDAHLAACPACRASLDASREVLDLVRLPAPQPAEALALADLPSRTLAELRRRDRRRGLWRRTAAAAAGLLLAAGFALALLSPAVFRGHGPEVPGAAPPVVAQAQWQEPDMDTLWSESAIVDWGSGSADEATMTDAVLAAYDAGAGI
jgi:anti-sigma factor RsiW